MPRSDSAPPEGVRRLADFPLLDAIFGRRSRRFGVGMEIPSGPLAFRSRHEPMPLSELESALLIAAATGVTGWNYGIPFTSHRPDEYAHYTERFTGRAAPVSAAIGTPALFWTDDAGVYVTNLRDVAPSSMREYDSADGVDALLDVCRAHTVRLSDARLDLPREPPHVMEHNLWVGNAPGSTLLMPVSDLSETFIAVLAIFVGSGYYVMDDTAGRPAGDLDPFFHSGLLGRDQGVPMSFVDEVLLTSGASELATMGHNAVLVMQAMGLGGWFYNGLSPYSILGAFHDDGVEGLGFRFVEDDRWALPNPVGLDEHFEGLCPPYRSDLRAAVDAFAARKFGRDGAFDPDTPGPFADSGAVKRSVTPYDDEFLACIAAQAQYVHDTYGRLPSTGPTMLLSGYVQAQHIDTDFYDTHYRPGAYLPTHADHMRDWHR